MMCKAKSRVSALSERPERSRAVCRFCQYSRSSLLVFCTLMFCVAAIPTSIAQAPRGPVFVPLDASESGRVSRGRPLADDPIEAAREVRRIDRLNSMRQKSIVDDAAKLLRLARELNDAASSQSSVLSSADRMHRVAEIEKLAKDVKEKMREAVGVQENPTGEMIRFR